MVNTSSLPKSPSRLFFPPEEAFRELTLWIHQEFGHNYLTHVVPSIFVFHCLPLQRNFCSCTGKRVKFHVSADNLAFFSLQNPRLVSQLNPHHLNTYIKIVCCVRYILPLSWWPQPIGQKLPPDSPSPGKHKHKHKRIIPPSPSSPGHNHTDCSRNKHTIPYPPCQSLY